MIDATQNALFDLGIGVILVDELGQATWRLRPAVASTMVELVPDSSVTAEVVSASGGSGESKVTGSMTWKGGRSVVVGDVRPLLGENFVVVRPGEPTHRMRPSNGEAFVVAAAWAVRGTYVSVRLVDDKGRVLSPEETLELGRRHFPGS